jgi:hypothetical protein
MHFRAFILTGLLGLPAAPGLCGDLKITDYAPAGQIGWTNALAPGVCTVETATNALPGSWQPGQNYFTTNSAGQGVVQPGAGCQFVRLLAVDVSTNTPQGYTNLLYSYGLLHTIAGAGDKGADGTDYWKPAFEGGYATNASLSRPHFAMADEAGNVFIVDKDSHAVLKITLDGRIHTVAGTHSPGDNGDGPAPATTLMLNQPNGLFVYRDGAFFVLDTGNGRVRWVTTNGVMSTLFKVSGGIDTGRGLWVEDDGQAAIFSSGSALKAWNPTKGVFTLNKSFSELGNLIVPATNYAIVTDRGANKVYTVVTGGQDIGQRTVLFGDGSTHAVVDGTAALKSGLNGVRGIWDLPAGGYLLALDEGSQIIYVDPADRVHVFLDGADGAHSGDGAWFHSPGLKISQGRSVTMDGRGNILFVENDSGYVRRIDFQRLAP